MTHHTRNTIITGKTKQGYYVYNGIVINNKYFDEIEDELFKYQLDHIGEVVPFRFLFSDERIDRLWGYAWHPLHSVELKKFRMALLDEDDYKDLVRNFLMKHPQWGNIVVSYDTSEFK